MKSPTKALLTAGLGAAAMYFFDPAQGRTRRDLARDRIDYGRNRLEQASQTAMAVGHDVGSRADRTIHRLRAVGHDVSERADGAFGRARSVGQGVGKRAGRLTHGLKSVGRDTGHRAAGAVSSLGSLFNGGRSRRRARSPLKLVGIPVMWLFVAGIGASVMYLFDPSQGIYRRARLRSRLPSQLSGGSADEEGRQATNQATNQPTNQATNQATDTAKPAQPAAHKAAGNASVGKQERPLSG